MNAKRCNETQIQHTAQSSIAGSTNGVDMSRVGERNLIEDVSHGLEEIKMQMKRQEQKQNSELSKDDIQSYTERHMYAWSKLNLNI